MISPLPRRKKLELAAATAVHLGVDVPRESVGSSIDSAFLNVIHTALFGSPSGGSDTYRMTERLLTRLGLVYDPRWDTSESRGETGGGTVTTRAFSRVLVAVTGEPRAFLVPANPDGSPSPVGGANRPTNNAFVDAGPGSRVLLFRRQGRSASVVGTAEVKAIEPGWVGPWGTEFWKIVAFEQPVALAVSGTLGNRPLEVSSEDFKRITDAGRRVDHASVSSLDPVEPAPWSADAAAFIAEAFPADAIEVAPLRVPIDRGAALPPREESVPEYSESEDDGRMRSTKGLDPTPVPTNRLAARLAEERAVTLATTALERAGWTLTHDRQKDGVGYDLLFERSGDEVHVEVKGIQGSELVFNLTPKEWWRARNDSAWFVVAVTSVLSPVEPRIHAVSRGEILSARRMTTGYRLWID